MEKNKSKGLGDTIEKITTATGIKKFVHKVKSQVKKIVVVIKEKKL